MHAMTKTTAGSLMIGVQWAPHQQRERSDAGLAARLQSGAAARGRGLSRFESVSIPVTFSVGTVGSGYGVDQHFTYNATQGKSGTAKAS